MVPMGNLNEMLKDHPVFEPLDKRTRELLVDNATKPMKKQKKILEDTFTQWKGDREQIDDIVVLGLEI